MRRRKRMLEELDEDIRQHIERETRDNIERGMAPEEARYAALRKFGNVRRVQEETREVWSLAWLEQLVQDVRYGLRVLRKSPGFTAVAVLTLALGIGANTLVFSVFNGLILRPLPVEHPERLVFLESNKGGAGQSFPNYRDLRDRNEVFSGLAGYRIAPMDLESNDGPKRIWGYLATGNYFDVIGVTPLMGQFFQQADDLHPGASPYAVLSYGCWKARFGGDAGIVGKTIQINRLSYTVLGVARPDFHGTENFYWPEVWVPMMMQAQIEIGNSWLENRMTFDTWLIGRLKPGVSEAQATANLNGIASELAREYPTINDGMKLKLARPGLIGDAIGGPAKTFAFGVLILAALVLLAACANLASLLSARAADRQREIAIRLSIGASRSRVMRQVLTETLLLSILGGAAGYGLAAALSAALSRWRAPMDFPVQFNVNPDWRVFLFALGVSILAGAFFGAIPAWNASGTDANAVLKGGESKLRRRRLAFRDVLVVVQVALCFVLVSGCLLSLRGLQRTLQMRLGFESRGVAVTAFELGLGGYDEPTARAFQKRVLQAVEALPGVESASYSNSLPLSIDQSRTTVTPADKPALRPSDGRFAIYYQVSPGFLRTIGTRLLEGRDFSWSDDKGSPKVAVVNEAFAKQILHAENPVGKYFHLGLSGPPIGVIGVVEDGKYETLTESEKPAMFLPILQSFNTTTTVEVRSSLPATEIVREMRDAIGRLDPKLPLYGSGSLDQMLGLAFLPSRAAAITLSAFGVLAIMLAATGVYGLVSYAVARRLREIGIRVAIGAQPRQVVQLVLGRTMMLLLVGAGVGFVLALAAGQVLASIVYQASPRDPEVLALVWATTILLGLIASLPPTRRALRVDPLVALRYE
ncbi:MAG TPA: ABC transporter permease [Candidatus Limnocylindrales bacterium]|nr:ABC transporter permease [Candidatus Limnocylindrales bacterium]